LAQDAVEFAVTWQMGSCIQLSYSRLKSGV